MSVPSPPDLDGERLFKLAMSTLLLGQVESDGGDAVAWERAVREGVPYHPAGRLPEQKLLRPELFKAPGDALDGELGLVQRLAQLNTVPERLDYMYKQSEAGFEARAGDPNELGDAWDPARWIAPEASWDALAGWSGGDTAFSSTLRRQLRATWVGVGLSEAHAKALEGELSGVCCSAQTLVETVEPLTEAADARIILVLEGDEGLPALDIFRDHAGLRDRTLAVVALGVPLWGRPGAEGALSEGARRDWMDAHFRHERLDTEAQRLTPYCAVQFLDWNADPPGAGGIGLASARFGPPKGLTEAPRIESVDLGPVPLDTAPALLVRALAATVGVLVLSKR